jgi:hypothetical protein
MLLNKKERSLLKASQAKGFGLLYLK